MNNLCYLLAMTESNNSVTRCNDARSMLVDECAHYDAIEIIQERETHIVRCELAQKLEHVLQEINDNLETSSALDISAVLELAHTVNKLHKRAIEKAITRNKN